MNSVEVAQPECHVPEDAANASKKGKLSFWLAVAHLLVGGASPTLLNLPATFRQVGYAVGVVGSCAVVLLYAYCMHTVVACEAALCKRLRTASLTYAEVLRHALLAGPRPTRCAAAGAKPLCYALFACIWVGGNATYVLLIGENVGAVLRYAVEDAADAADAADARTVIAYAALPLVALCWMPDLKAMAVCSVASNALNALSVAVVLSVALQRFPFFGDRAAVGDLSRVPYFLGVLLITVNGTGLVLSLKSAMRSPHEFTAKFGVLNAAYAPTAALYAVFGCVCYGKYGADTADTVILNLPRGLFSCLIQAMYALAITLFYPLVTYVTYEIAWTEFTRYRSAGAKYSGCAKYAIKTVNGLLAVALAYAVPNISVFVSLIGNVCVALDSVIVPAAMEMLIHWGSCNFWLRAKISMMMAVGALLMVVGFQDLYSECLRYYCQ